MIYDQLKHAEHYRGLPDIYRALEYLRTLTPDTLPQARVELDGGRIFANTVRLTSKPQEECVFEAHRKYIDVHYIVSGVEGIGVASTDGLQPREPFNEEQDIGFYQGEQHSLSFLHPGEFMVCWPEDAHKVAVAQAEPGPIVKLVVKVAVG